MKALKENYFHIIDTVEERIVELRHEIHAHPELSGAEKETKAL
ncbi:MAG TPA: amidohydrolase, partial [Epsilonproteobacteria bacterium]|nr:amidohydrolase [Campylobacterota bacterium]